MDSPKITCPECGHTFALEEVLAEQIELQYKQKFEQEKNAWQKRQRAEEEKLKKEKQKLEEQKAAQEETLREALRKKLREEKVRIQKETEKDYGDRIKNLKAKLEQFSKMQMERDTLELELQKARAEMNNQQEKIRLEMEKEMLEKRREIEKQARMQLEEKYDLKMRELKIKLEEQKKLAEEMKRRADQGSMQLQGETQELAIEQLLQDRYPRDLIKEVKKGARGADCIQTVLSASGRECGKIVYESKRTKNFSNSWIEKLKNDRQESKADIAVLVTQVFPKNMKRFGLVDGVWICHFSELESVSFVLREMLIRAYGYRAAQQNKGEKMEILYDYLTSSEFAGSVQRLMETYQNMYDQLQKEKRAMTKLWKEREKQIQTMEINTAEMFGAIKGIAGKELRGIDPFALPEGGEE